MKNYEKRTDKFIKKCNISKNVKADFPKKLRIKTNVSSSYPKKIKNSENKHTNFTKNQKFLKIVQILQKLKITNVLTSLSKN